MAQDKGKKGKGSAQVIDSPAPDYGDDAAPDEGTAVPAVATGALPAMQQAEDPHAEPTQLDPGGDIATDFRTQVVGREIVITRWGLVPAAEEFANANTYGVFATLGFYFADDTERKGRFTTNGSQRIVETVYQALNERTTKLPTKATVVAFHTRGGFTGYRFARPGETIR